MALIHLPPQRTLSHTPQVEVVELRQDQYDLQGVGVREEKRNKGGKRKLTLVCVAEYTHLVSPRGGLSIYPLSLRSLIGSSKGEEIINLMHPPPSNW